MKLLFIGDVVGNTGCEFLKSRLPKLKRDYEADIIVVNGENSADGNGITSYSAQQIFQAGADVITTGNHAFQRKTDLHIYEKRDFIERMVKNKGSSQWVAKKKR